MRMAKVAYLVVLPRLVALDQLAALTAPLRKATSGRLRRHSRRKCVGKSLAQACFGVKVAWVAKLLRFKSSMHG